VTTDERGARHRRRLLAGMTTAVARKGYAAVTIADVVAEAGVSKRTFYEHFSSKQDCLLACYVEANSTMMASVRQKIDQAVGSREDMVAAVIDSYLRFLDRSPQMTTTLLIEVQRAGSEGRRIFRANSHDFAELIRRTVWPEFGEAFAHDQAIALLGGVNALLLTHAEEQPNVPFSVIGPSVLHFVRAVISDRSERVGS
jgi:AcrR family transcriptional regulator